MIERVISRRLTTSDIGHGEGDERESADSDGRAHLDIGWCRKSAVVIVAARWWSVLGDGDERWRC